jgi:outer membrane protein assembly factor BamB
VIDTLRKLRILMLVTATGLLAGCGVFDDLLGGDKDPELEPAKLEKITETLKIRKIWSTDLGKESDFLRVALRPTGDGARIYAASANGNVHALDPETGKRIWRTELKVELTAGPGVGNGVVAVMAADGFLVVLDAETGEEQWRTDIDGESLAQPLIEDDLIVIQTIDNRLRAVAVTDGRPKWTIEQKTPALTLRGSASPLTAGGNIVAGFDNGRLVAIDAETGDIAWDSMLSPPSGRSDLERLSDVDGQLAVVGQDIYAAGYQGTLASVAAESGQVLWQQEISTFVGVAADWNNLYTADENGEIIAMTRRSGTEEWRQAALLRRWPTLPVPFHTAVVAGDFKGYLHFFSNVDGEPVARTRLGKKAISGAPYVAADRLFVQSDSGKLHAFVAVEEEPEQNEEAEDETQDEEA